MTTTTTTTTFDALLSADPNTLTNERLTLSTSDLELLQSLAGTEIATFRGLGGNATNNRADRDTAHFARFMNEGRARAGLIYCVVGERQREARGRARVYLAVIQHFRALTAALRAGAREARWPAPGAVKIEAPVIFKPATPAFCLPEWCNDRRATLLDAGWVRVSADGLSVLIAGEWSPEEETVLAQNAQGVALWINAQFRPARNDTAELMATMRLYAPRREEADAA